MKRLCLLLALTSFAGCSSRPLTNTPRSAIEQLLLTAAVDKAMEKFQMPELAGKKVFTDFSNLKAYDQEYIRVAFRARIAKIGATLVEKADQADLIAEVASGALGTEYKDSVVGLPPLPIPNSPTPLPEASAYKSTEQTGIFKLFVFVHAKGRFVAATHYYAKADRTESFVFWWRSAKQDDIREGWERADLEHRKKQP